MADSLVTASTWFKSEKAKAKKKRKKKKEKRKEKKGKVKKGRERETATQAIDVVTRSCLSFGSTVVNV